MIAGPFVGVAHERQPRIAEVRFDAAMYVAGEKDHDVLLENRRGFLRNGRCSQQEGQRNETGKQFQAKFASMSLQIGKKAGFTRPAEQLGVDFIG